MILLTQDLVDKYEKPILEVLRETSVFPDSLSKSHMWLADSPQKRAVYNLMYGEYLQNTSNVKMLDVGGGYSSLTRLLIKNTQKYELIDPLYGDQYKDIPRRNNIDSNFIVGDDWYKHKPSEYDVVIANDIFPNIDQRLRIFLERYIKVSHKIILSLTYYNTPKFYRTKRIEGDERLCFLAYTGKYIRDILIDYLPNIIDPDFSVLDSKETLFYNGRQICIIEIEGEL